MAKSNSKLVYSTDQGRIKQAEPAAQREQGDGIIRIRRETKGRKGKGVTTLSGFDLDDKALKALGKSLKQLCGTGGTCKEGIIEIQGDHRDTLKQALEKQGFTAKLAGG